MWWDIFLCSLIILGGIVLWPVYLGIWINETINKHQYKKWCERTGDK